jgi:hypothetical protein
METILNELACCLELLQPRIECTTHVPHALSVWSYSGNTCQPTETTVNRHHQSTETSEQALSAYWDYCEWHHQPQTQQWLNITFLHQLPHKILLQGLSITEAIYIDLCPNINREDGFAYRSFETSHSLPDMTSRVHPASYSMSTRFLCQG